MIRSARTLALAAASAVALAACSGGGSTGQTALAPAPTAAPAAARAQASITIRYTPNVHRLRSSASKRGPRFVDPNGAKLLISSISKPSNVQLDAVAFAVNPGVDGSQTLAVPITTSSEPGSTTVITVVEVGSDNVVLAAGGGQLTGVQPGTLVTGPAITLFMRAAGVLATADPFSDPSDATALSNDPAAPTPLFDPTVSKVNACQAQLQGFLLLPFDADFDFVHPFVALVGAGGIPPVQILEQHSSKQGGKTRLATDATGIFHILFDQARDDVIVHVGVYDLNPAAAPGTLLTQAYVQLRFDGNCD